MAPKKPTSPPPPPVPVENEDGWRWTTRRLVLTLLGGWLVIVALALFLHFILGPFRVVDLGAILLAIVWGLVMTFVGAEDRLTRHRKER